MIVISNNLLPLASEVLDDSVVIRINAAWHPDVQSLVQAVRDAGKRAKVMLDVPWGRKKPPIVSLTYGEAAEIARMTEVNYLAVSNVESQADLDPYIDWDVEVVPKIETIIGCAVFSTMKGFSTAMLDHDDLFTDVLENGRRQVPFPGPDARMHYLELVRMLEAECAARNITLLKTAGVVFTPMGRTK